MSFNYVNLFDIYLSFDFLKVSLGGRRGRKGRSLKDKRESKEKNGWFGNFVLSFISVKTFSSKILQTKEI